MNYIEIEDNFGQKVKLAYQDLGSGQPVLFIHGWPLSQEMWEYQVTEFVNKGMRCITYDRRGFGQSDKPWKGYDYDTFAADLKAVINYLNLEDVVLVGFSMGGGEVVRYFKNYGADRISKAVLISSVTPYLLKTGDNPKGVEASVFDDMMSKMKNDRLDFLENFGKQFFGVNLVSHPISAPLLEYYKILASFASPIATMQSAVAFAETDFRQDMKAVTVPTLIIHGGGDKTVPIEASGDRSAADINDSQYHVYDGAPHGLFYTEKDRLNADLLGFINPGII